MGDMIRVVAPATLQEGFSFEVLVDGKPFVVVVPNGGVKEGQEFEVPYSNNNDSNNQNDDDNNNNAAHSATAIPIPSDEEVAIAASQNYDAIGAPMGRWRTPLCSCCDVMTQATPWMACFCAPVLVGQLLARMHLAWHGHRTNRQEASMSFNRIVLGFIAVLYFANVQVAGVVFELIYMIAVIWIVGFRVRRYFRKKYRIPPGFFGKCHESLDDICCVVCCSCCSMIQMARHTHNDKEYPGYCCTTTGLDMQAPEVPDDV